MSKVVQYILRVKDEASPALDRAGDEASRLAAELRKAREESAKALGSLAAQAANVGQSSSKAATALGQHADGAKRAASASIGLQNVTRNLGYQIGDVVQSIQAGQNPMQALVVQLTDIAFQFDIMAVASRAASIAVGPVGVGVAALATGLTVAANATKGSRMELEEYQKALKDTDSTTRRLIQSQNALKLASGDVAGFVADLQIQTALMKGEISEFDVRAGELGGTLADTLEPRLRAAGKAFAENEIAIQGYREALRSGRLNVEEQVKAQQMLDKALAARPGLEANIESLKQLRDTGLSAINDNLSAMEAFEAATKDAAGSVKQLAEEIASVPSIDLGDPAALSRAGLTGPTITDRIDGQALSQAFSNAMGDADLSGPLTQAFRTAQTLAGRTGAMAARGAGALLSPGASLAAAGPIGAGLAALSQIGEQGVDRIVQRLTDLGTNIIKGFSSLPELFGRLLVELPVALGEAVAEALRNLLRPGSEGFSPFKGKLTARDILGIGTLGISELTGLGAAADALFGGDQGFAAGDTRFINRTGMAVVHQGETIVRSNGGSAAGIAQNMRGGGGGPPIIVQAAAVTPDVLKGLSDQIGQQFDPGGWGRGTRTVFGG